MNKIAPSVSSSSGSPFFAHKDLVNSTSSDASAEKHESSPSLKSKRSESEASEKENESQGEQARHIPGLRAPLCKTIVNVGFSQLPKQVYRKTNHRGFTFNVIVVGVTGLGKSTFLNTLFMSDVYDEKHPVSETFFRHNIVRTSMKN